MKLPVEKRLQKAHTALVMDKNFTMLSGILMLGESKIVKTPAVVGGSAITTAYTNGRDKMYCKDYVETLTDKELAFVVAHENFHVMFKHLTTYKSLYLQDPNRANKACDYVINQMIVDLDLNGNVVSPPEGVLLDPRFKGLSAKEVFDLLPPSGSKEGNGSGALDTHDWKNADEMSEGERRELEEAIDAAVRQGDMLAGKMKGTGPREIGALPEPTVDWRTHLREFITSFAKGKDRSTWRKPNRRWLAHGVYMPTTFSEQVGRALVALDTSGSISHELEVFLAELKSILEDVPPKELDLVYWGSSVVAHEHYTPDEYKDMTTKTNPMNGGGTSPHCIAEWLRGRRPTEQPEFIVVFTDGYIYDGWPAFDAPTLWVVVDNPQATATSGTTLHINSRTM